MSTDPMPQFAYRPGSTESGRTESGRTRPGNIGSGSTGSGSTGSSRYLMKTTRPVKLTGDIEV